MAKTWHSLLGLPAFCFYFPLTIKNGINKQMNKSLDSAPLSSLMTVRVLFLSLSLSLLDSLHGHLTISVQTSPFPLWINQTHSKVQQAQKTVFKSHPPDLTQSTMLHLKSVPFIYLSLPSQCSLTDSHRAVSLVFSFYSPTLSLSYLIWNTNTTNISLQMIYRSAPFPRAISLYPNSNHSLFLSPVDD